MSTYTVALLIRANGTTSSGNFTGTILSADTSGGTRVSLIGNTAGVYITTGSGSTQLYLTKGSVTTGTYNNLVTINQGNFYLIHLVYGPNNSVTNTYTYTNPSNIQYGQAVPSVSGTYSLNTYYQVGVYVNGINCGFSACAPPAYNSGSILSIDSAATTNENHTSNTCQMSMVSLTIYDHAFTQSEVNTYTNFIKTIYPNITLSAPY